MVCVLVVTMPMARHRAQSIKDGQLLDSFTVDMVKVLDLAAMLGGH
jgi:hypothetical protein